MIGNIVALFENFEFLSISERSKKYLFIPENTYYYLFIYVFFLFFFFRAKQEKSHKLLVFGRVGRHNRHMFRIQKVMMAEYNDIYEPVIVENPFTQVTECGQGLRQYHIGSNSNWNI